jgi:hypothetical protein
MMRARSDLTHPGLRRRLVALAFAYLLALQGLVAAWGTSAAIAATLTPAAAGIICTSADHGSSTDRDNGPSPCCLCGPMCHTGWGSSVGAAPATAVTVLRLPIAAGIVWMAPRVGDPQRILLSPWQARAPPAMA